MVLSPSMWPRNWAAKRESDASREKAGAEAGSGPAHEVARAIRAAPGVGRRRENRRARCRRWRRRIPARALVVVLRRDRHDLAGREIEGLDADPLAGISARRRRGGAAHRSACRAPTWSCGRCGCAAREAPSGVMTTRSGVTATWRAPTGTSHLAAIVLAGLGGDRRRHRRAPSPSAVAR